MRLAAAEDARVRRADDRDRSMLLAQQIRDGAAVAGIMAVSHGRACLLAVLAARRAGAPVRVLDEARRQFVETLKVEG
ncbi:hypothetical protein WMF38_57125 [Sorangium sp. So ce118]